MIYKFKDSDDFTLEVERFTNETDYGAVDVVSFTSVNNDDTLISVELDKKDVYHLIGALHLLHKEMK